MMTSKFLPVRYPSGLRLLPIIAFDVIDPVEFRLEGIPPRDRTPDTSEAPCPRRQRASVPGLDLPQQE